MNFSIAVGDSLYVEMEEEEEKEEERDDEVWEGGPASGEG